MNRNRPHPVEPQAPPFMPFGVLEWRTLFTHPDRVQIQLEVPTYRQQTRGVRWYGDVILEGLLHERHGGHRL